jgi:D-proline reductase (dithiol) PrdB
VSHQVDSYRFVDFVTRKVVQGWITSEEPKPIPWTPLSKPMSEANVALVSSGGIALTCDEPFDQEGERRNPWWGDPSFRILPRTATEGDVEIYHLHIDASFARRDLNCVLPLQRLSELEALGEIGKVAPRHYSFMGYTLDPTTLLEESTPAMIQCLQEDQVDLAVLVPI